MVDLASTTRKGNDPMGTIVDRRNEKKGRYHSSKERFIARNKKGVRKAIERKIADSDLDDVDKGGVDVTVPKKGVHEPFIHHGKGGTRRKTLPGNKNFSPGDTIPKPPSEGGGNGEGDPSNSGEGEDAFVFSLSEEEFLDILFEDLELPNLTKQAIQDSKKTELKRAGFVNSGPPNKMDLVRSKQSQLMRHAAFKKPKDRKILDALKKQMDVLHPQTASDMPRSVPQSWPMAKKIRVLKERVEELKQECFSRLPEEDKDTISNLDKDIGTLEKKKSLVPMWNESTDLRYRYHDEKTVPTAKAVMFCLMDVSYSMTQERKNNAKLFYWLLYKFLQRNYDQVDLVFIRHTQVAEEVDEQTFFYDTQTGGTLVSSSIEKMKEIMGERYPTQEWNIYGAQASDGENSDNDNKKCEALIRSMLPDLQAYFFTKVSEQDFSMWSIELWETLRNIVQTDPNKFFMGKIKDRKDIWHVFRDFFQKREQYDATPSSLSASRYQPSLP